jgi:GT2 family glycosyltransferase
VTRSSRAITLVCCTTHPADEAVAATRRSVVTRSQPDVHVEIVPSLAAASEAIARADGWVGFLDPGDVLAPDAVATIRSHVEDDPLVDLVYTDEAAGGSTDARPVPFHKPGWSPDRLRCQPYTGRLTLARTEIVSDVGGLRPELASVAEHDLVLRIAERTRHVAHVPEVLCDRRALSQSYAAFDPDHIDVACRVLDEHLERLGIEAVGRPHATAAGLLRLEPVLRTRPLVSIVIPTAGARRRVRGVDVNLVVSCVRSILSRSTYAEIEIVCVTDESVDDATRRQLTDLDPSRVRLVAYEGPFHFSRKVNRGALAASGDVLLVLNDDTEVQTPGWIEAMLIYALDPGVGAVGARLLFEDGRIQHIGVVGVGGNPGHPYHGLAADTVGHGANALVPGDFLAVTGACLMTRRETFEEVGGMSSWFPANYNDLDYCLKLGNAGYRVVATPDAVLAHFESSSRSGEVATTELDLIRRRWGRLLQNDPYYGPNFRSGIADFEPSRD